ncbi:oligosaccharide flippase family protein [bacterium]|nr:oligosaccharide flippase family protein [bacterium]
MDREETRSDSPLAEEAEALSDTASSTSGLRRHGIVNLLSKFFGQGLAYVSIVLVARVMSDQNFGWLSIVLVWFSLGAMFATGGLEFVLLRFFGLFMKEGRFGQARGLSRLATRVALGGGLLIAILIEVSLVAAGLLGPNWLALLILLPVLPCLAYISIRRNEMLAMERSFLSQLPVSIVRPLATIFLLGLLVWLFDGTPPLVIGAIAIAGGFVVGAVTAYVASRFVLREFSQEHVERGPIGEWFSIGSSMILVTFGFLAMNQVDTIMVGALRSEAEAGFYSAAFRIAALLTLPTITLQSIVASRISQAHVANNQETLTELSRWVANWGLLLTSLLAIVVISGRDFLLGLFGPEFRVASGPLVFLGISAVAASFLGPTAYLLHLTGRQRILAVVTALGFVANLVGNYFAVSRFGMTGAAVSTMIALFLTKLTMVIVVRRVLGLWPFATFGLHWRFSSRNTMVGAENGPSESPTSDELVQATKEPSKGALRPLFVDRLRSPRKRWFTSMESLQAVGVDVALEHLPGNTIWGAVCFPRAAWRHRDRRPLISFFVSPVGLIASLVIGRFILRGPVLFYMGGDPFRGYEDQIPDNALRGLGSTVRRRVLGPINGALQRFCLKRADGLIVVSKQLGELLCEASGFEGPVILVPPASAKVRCFKPRDQRPIDRNSTTELLMVTNLAYQSKYEGVLEVLKGLCLAAEERKGELVFRLAGDGRFMDVLHGQIREMRLPPNLKLDILGFVDDVETLYPRADLFLYSSDFDSRPNVIFEAMASGLPILLKEADWFEGFVIADRNAVLFKPDDPIDFAKCLAAILEDVDRRRVMGETNVRDVARMLDRETVGHRLEEGLRRVLGVEGGNDD